MEEIIVARDVIKSFHGKSVLNGVSLTLERRQNIVLLGRSGEGKSVLLKILVGLIDPDSGYINILGMNVTELEENELVDLRSKVGYLFQEGALYDFMTVGENISFSLTRMKEKKSKQEINFMVESALHDVGLLEAIDKHPKELSGGMKKRVALARTLVLKPQIILYDEPTTGLDPATSRGIIKLIQDTRDRTGISSIIVTHDMICAKALADKILILNKGKIAAAGTYAELERDETEFVNDFFL